MYQNYFKIAAQIHTHDKETLINHTKEKIGISRIFKVPLESYQDGGACNIQDRN